MKLPFMAKQKETYYQNALWFQGHTHCSLVEQHSG